MGWSIGYDGRWGRDIGYGVPAYCDHPECWATIDRGLAYVCGNAPYGGERGCGLYFCGHHLFGPQLCRRCRASRPPYRVTKPEHPEWVQHKLSDPSWEDWRQANPKEVAALKGAA